MKKLLKSISPFNNRTDMDDGLFIVKKMLAFWLCYIGGLVIAEVLAILLHFAMGKNMLVGDVFDDKTISLIINYGFIVVIAIVLLYWKLVEKKPISKIGANKKFGTYFIGAGIGVFLLVVSVVIVVLTGNIEYKGIFENIDVVMVLLMAGGFVIQGAMEEFLCRGLVFQSLKEKTSTSLAITISTVLFIIPHSSSLFAGETLYGFVGVVNLVLISLIFSFLTIQFDSIWVACGLHSAWNAVLYCVMGLNLSGLDKPTAVFNMQSVGDNIINGSAYGIEASIVTTVVLGIFTAVLIFVGKKNKKEN